MKSNPAFQPSLPGDGAKVRLAEISDLADCLGLLGQFYTEEGINTTAEQMEAPLLSLLGRHQGAVFLAETGLEKIGIAVVAIATGIEQGGLLAELTDLYVLPAFRHQGVGGSLTAFAANWARENHCRRIQLLVTAMGQATPGLISFYEQYDFRTTGRIVLSRHLD